MLPWDHNAWYHALLLRQLPKRMSDVLEIGCGEGALAVKLAARSDRVLALDRSPVMVDLARAAAPDRVTYEVGDVMSRDLPAGAYDAVVSMSVLHHLPLEPALERMAASLRPGGVLVAVALPRVDLPRELPVQLVASVVHHGLGVLLGLARLFGAPAFRHTDGHAQMPMEDPELTVRQVRRRVTLVLPGAEVRRLLLWRYLLVWHKPR